MSDPVRVGLIVEGPTDAIVLQAAIRSLLAGRDVEFSHVQPDLSEAFEFQPSAVAGGWSGVYLWCRQAVEAAGGQFPAHGVFANHHLIVIQVDADVAGKTYQSGNIQDAEPDLPCEQPCPPPEDTTNALRAVICRWVRQSATPAYCVLCTPSKSMETWVIQALVPSHRAIAKGHWECHPDPESQLGQLPSARRIKKSRADYRSRAEEITRNWPRVRAKLTEAERFSSEFLGKVPP